MPTCASCGSTVSQATPFCAQCGRPHNGTPEADLTLDNNALATVDVPRTPAAPRPASSRPSSTSSSRSSRTAGGRFVPGALVAGRYRIIALLGKGGMGEVYRADDLSLEQQVALKFLPESASDEETLERFRNEVRIARRISHPNVCRVYDLGEADGHIFLSMEYIDGEDLASLLRRIGRLPSDKATEIARKICAGLAAAHAQRVLHRDLKPANVMLNGEGEVLIMDFGLAAAAHEIEDIRSGTLAYMSPEQLSGKEVTVRSDIYSLGLLLYELFTGRRAFEGKTYDEIIKGRRDNLPSRPSSLVKDLDPVTEKAILQCLDNDASHRPASALAVAAALPGGDPLAAALAAGITPSPQMVAAAGENIGLRLRSATLWLSLALFGFVVFCVLGARNSGVGQLNPSYSPEVLSARARDLTSQLGYPTPTDSADGFALNRGLYEFLDAGKITWKEILRRNLPLAFFWHRESPEYLATFQVHDSNLVIGTVDRSDPPPTTSGMSQMSLDAQGRLLYFEAVPPQKLDTPAVSTPPDWNRLFAMAGLDPAQFKPADPLWTPLGATDTRVAWTGTWPGTSTPLRVEAASYGGKPIFFSLIGEWTRANRMKHSDTPLSSRILPFVLACLSIVVVAGAVLIAWRNSAKNRIDSEGARRLAILYFCLHVAVFFLTTHFVPSVSFIAMFMLNLTGAVFGTAVVTIIYLALEPYIRRHWPQAIISWSRLMSGKLRDHNVGRDVLYGMLLGLSWAILYQFVFLFQGGAPSLSDVLPTSRGVVGTMLEQVMNSVRGALAFFFLMFVLRVILKKGWLAALVFVGFFTTLKVLDATHLAYALPVQLAIYSIAAYIIARFGLISLIVGIFSANVMLNLPISANLSAWYMGYTIFAIIVLVALTLWAAYTSLGEQELWKDQLFE